MSERCGQCGERGHPANAAYCFRCGSRLARDEASYTPRHLESVLDAPDARGGERKDVTVLFADVAGSLALTAALDPEDLHAVMNGFFAVANDAIHSEGGQINQYRGDGFMALFGAPRALSDNAARACRAALEIRAATERYAESVRARFGHPLVLRLGINTGVVWVGSIGTRVREDYTAEGPTVGVAARIEEFAAPGQILVAEETWRRCAPFFEWSDLGERAIRGLPERVRVYELLRPGPHAERIGVERARGPTPLVGRSRELRKLEHLTAPAPGVRCVEVAGEPGIGKSRLVFEHLQRLGPEIAVLELHAREAHRQRAYLPFAELLRRWPERPAPPAGVADLLARLEGRAEDAREQRVNAALRELVSAIVEVQPTVLVIEDVHWLDSSSASVIRELSQSSPAGSLVVLATLRSEPAADWGAVHAERMELAPLSESEAFGLATEVLGPLEDSDDLVALAVLRGGGNPLFVEEVARSLREGPELVRHSARLEVALRREPAQVPRTLHSVVAARIDALELPAKRALEAAAVLGQPFDLSLLGEMEGAAASVISPLCDRGLLRTLGDGEIDFCHGVVREVARDQLVRHRSVDLNRRAAEVLLLRPLSDTPDGAARIGAHYDAAGESARAAPHLVRAGRLYAGLDAFGEAAGQLRRGIELLGSADETAQARASASLVLAASLNALDRTEEAGAVLEGVDEAALQAGDQSTLARALIQAGWVRFSVEAESGRARGLVERGLALAGDDRDNDREIMLGHSYLARMLTLDGDVRAATRETRWVVDQASRAGDVGNEVLALYNDAMACCDAGRLDDAARSSRRALELARERAEPILIGSAELAAAKVALFQGDFEESVQATDRAVSSSGVAGQMAMVYQAAALSGYAHVMAGRPREGHRVFESLAELAQTWPDRDAHRARGFLEVGEPGRAVELARACLGSRPPRLARTRATAVLGLALGLADPHAFEEAEDLLGQAVSTFDELGLVPLRAESHLFLAELLAKRGDPSRARYYADRAIAGYESCGMTPYADAARALVAD